MAASTATPAGQRILTWTEAIERRVSPGQVHIDAAETCEQVDGGVILRQCCELKGRAQIHQESIGLRLWRVTASLTRGSAPGTLYDGAVDEAIRMIESLVSELVGTIGET